MIRHYRRVENLWSALSIPHATENKKFIKRNLKQTPVACKSSPSPGSMKAVRRSNRRVTFWIVLNCRSYKSCMDVVRDMLFCSDRSSLMKYDWRDSVTLTRLWRLESDGSSAKGGKRKCGTTRDDVTTLPSGYLPVLPYNFWVMNQIKIGI